MRNSYFNICVFDYNWTVYFHLRSFSIHFLFDFKAICGTVIVRFINCGLRRFQQLLNHAMLVSSPPYTFARFLRPVLHANQLATFSHRLLLNDD